MNTLLLKTTVNEGELALAHDELDRAELAFRSALTLDPANPVAHAGLGEIARVRGVPILRVIDGQREALAFEQEVRLAVRLSRLVGDDIPARHAFVLSKLVSGPRKVADMIYACDFPPAQVLDILERAVEKGIVAVIS